MRLGAIAMLAAALAGACGSGEPAGFVRRIEEATQRAAARSVPLDLGAVTDLDWERFHAFSAYASSEAVNRGLGFEWADDGFTSPDSDGEQLLLFVRGGKVIEQAEMGRCFPDFVMTRRLESGVSRADAVFALTDGEVNCVKATPIR